MNNYVASQQCKARNLIVGKTYQFRVMAENKYGVSDPAITVDPVTARHPFGNISRVHKTFGPTTIFGFRGAGVRQITR